jgi:hypothetical protein
MQKIGKTALLSLGIALIALVGLGLPGSASPAGTIVIRGADSGSTLQLSVDGNSIKVHGYMEPGEQVGCRVTRARIDATCPLGGVEGVEVIMGPSGDFVEVLDRLPVPLTAYLGDGSDKIIANGERDTCYPGGAKRNRCVLGGGDDICITGDRNSDCVGGSGDDYCEHGDGSDGCWGGPGDDICVMKSGMDG